METFTGTISIDGKGTFSYVLTPVGAAAVIPIPPAESTNGPVPQANGSSVVSVMLLKHEMKSGPIKTGSRAGQTWVKHSFRASDNRWYTTFDDKMTAQLSPLVGAGTPVKLAVKANDFKGYDITAVLGS